MKAPDRLEFIKEVLQSAPAGQFDTLLEDIQTVSGGPLDGEVLKDIQARYQSQTCATTTSEGDSSHPLIASLREQVEKHQQNVAPGVTARRDVAVAGDANQILLRTYAERVDKEKCRTGSWMAEWTIQSEAGSSSAEVSGKVNICSFSFEDGNIQLRTTKEFPAVKVEGSASDLAAAILQQIVSWEKNLCLSLQEICYNAGQSLKSIRGILPLTHRKLNWNVVAQRTVKSLQETVSK